MYPNTGLPFSPEFLQAQPLNITMNNIPFVPNAQMSNAHLQQMLPVVAGGVIIEINSKAGNNALRRFMFNQCVQNNFCNREVETVILAAMDMLELEAAKRNAPYDNLVQYVVPQMVTMFASNNVRLFPDLGNYIPPDVVQEVHGAIAAFDNISNEIRSFKAQQQQQMGGYRGGYQAGGYNPQGYNTPRAGYNPGGGGYQGGNAGRASGNSLYYTNNQPQQSARDERFDRYATNAQQQVRQPSQPVQQTENKEVQMQPEEQQVDFLGETHPTLWRPSKDFPYLPAYNPTEKVLWFRKQADGSVMPYFKNLEKDVDFDRHNIQTVFGPVPRVIEIDDTGKTLNDIASALKMIKDENQTLSLHDASSDEPMPHTPHIRNVRYIDVALETVWFSAAMDRIGVDNGETPHVYRAYAQVAEPVIGFKDETDYVRELASSKTLIELREKMKGSADEISKELWMVCHRKATDMVNRVVRNNVSLPGLSIESFVDDVEDLLNLIERKYGLTVREAIEKHQKENIKACFNLLDENIAKGMTADMIGDRQFGEGHVPTVTYLISEISITLINCLATELEVQLPVGHSGALTKDGAKQLYFLAKDLFLDLESTPGSFERHYIRTLDHRTLELTKGYLGEGFYMLSLVE